MVAAADNHFIAAFGPVNNLYRIIRSCALYLYAFLAK